jgi:hypothetical protein
VVKRQQRLTTALATNFYGGKKIMTKRIKSIMDTTKKRAGLLLLFSAVILTVGCGALFGDGERTPGTPVTNLLGGNQPTPPPVNTNNTNPADGFTMPAFTLIEITEHQPTAPPEAMSMQTVAELGARYIYDVFGVNIEGMYMTIYYTDWSESAFPRMMYGGTVTLNDPMIGIEPYPYEPSHVVPMFNFMLDAVTGMRINMICLRPLTGMDWQEGIPEWWDFSGPFLEASGWNEMSFEQRLTFAEIPQALIDEKTQLARQIAQNHFNETNVTDVRAGCHAERFNITVVAFPPDENRIIRFRAETIYFTATDDTGRQLEMLLSFGTDDPLQRLILTTEFNDVN